MFQEAKNLQIKYILCIAYVIFAVSGLLLIKYGSNRYKSGSFVIPLIGVPITLYSIIGIICYGVSFLLYLGVISKFNLGIAIPILAGVINSLILFASVIIFKEQLTYNMIIGAIIIIIGIIIMTI